MDWKTEIKRKAEYALRSHDKAILYEAYGMAKMAYNLEAISKDEFYELNDLIVVLGMNSPKKCREIYGGFPR